GGAAVGQLDAGGLQFNDVFVPASGPYVLQVDWLGIGGDALLSVNGAAGSAITFSDGRLDPTTTLSLRVNLLAGHNTIRLAGQPGSVDLAVDLIRVLGGARDTVTLGDVPPSGPRVTGAAVTHEHLASELAFSGKWFWGSVMGGSESVSSCDGSG